MALQAIKEDRCFYVVHPLFDAPEQKRSVEGLGPMKMTPSVKVSLLTLQGYLVVMLLLLVYHVLDLAGVLHHLL
jgi:hypothetical protein